jgi:hypothetical protein
LRESRYPVWNSFLGPGIIVVKRVVSLGERACSPARQYTLPSGPARIPEMLHHGVAASDTGDKHDVGGPTRVGVRELLDWFQEGLKLFGCAGDRYVAS